MWTFWSPALTPPPPFGLFPLFGTFFFFYCSPKCSSTFQTLQYFANENSSSHEHIHALVKRDTLSCLGSNVEKRTKISSQNNIEEVLCYIYCGDEHRATRQNCDGLLGAPHTYYQRSLHGNGLLHKRSTKDVIVWVVSRHQTFNS